MAEKVNIDYLRKSDLIFELKVRKFPTVGSVMELRKNLRKCIKEKAVDTADYKFDIDLNTEVRECEQVSIILANDLENLEDSCNRNDFERFKVRNSSFNRRLDLAIQACDSELDEVSIKRLELLKEVSRSNLSIFARFLVNYKPSEPLVDLTTKISKITVSNNNTVLENVGLAEASVADNRDNNEKVVVPEVKDRGSNFFSIYNRLPNPIDKILNQLPKSDGSSIEILLKFLRLSVFIFNGFPEVREHLLVVLVPYTLGSLNRCLTRDLRRGFQQFHKEVIDAFIPDRVFSTLKQNLFLRCQGNLESLSEYISDIREAKEILRLELTEGDVVRNIVTGLNPSVRNCLTFCSRPNNYKDLDALCIEVLNIQCSDNQRDSANVAQNKTPVQVAIKQRSRSFNPVCYSCHQSGHISPRCPNREGNNFNNGTGFSKNV